jgi:Kef-type K+ transport system membrane component KefB
LFPDEVRALLSALATVGLAWFMFAIGLEVEPGTARAGVSLTAGATVVPFVLGAGLAAVLLQRHETSDPSAFAFFVGLAMTATAFPVLARILADRGLVRTTVGRTAMVVAARVDLLVWVALAGVQAWVVGGRSWTTALVVPYLMLMFLVVRPSLRRAYRATGDKAAHRSDVVFLGLALLSGAATEAMGLHFIFGAFVAGVVIPPGDGGRLRVELRELAARFSVPLLSVYFVIAGQAVDFGALVPADLAEGVLILAVAVVGKVGGTYLGARLGRFNRSDASLLAVLLNTRGLAEIIILGVGLEIGLLDPILYSLMVAMAVITTVTTGPLVTLLDRVRRAPPP